MNQYMKIAFQEARLGMDSNHGGPFGAVIVKNGAVIASGHNEVIKTNDPTAHAEMVVIRKAADFFGRFNLSDCEIYTSCEPCPMCLAAIYWSRIKKVHYGCTKEDAAEIGFDDQNIYRFLANPTAFSDTLQLVPLDRKECLENFVSWINKEDKAGY